MKAPVLFFLFFISSLTGFAQGALNTKQLDKKLKELQESTQTVGFSVAVVKGNEVIYAKGFGYRDLENKLKVDENTLFAIGSTSKAFTTALLGIMEEEKGLSFTDSPKKYLPELEFFNEDLNNNVTILDMVSHRTGLPRHDFSWYLFPSEEKDSLLSRVKYQEPFTGINNTWYYNNFMYLAQGLIAEKLTGKSWEDNIRDRFFAPLNMTTSNLSIAELKQQNNISKGYGLENFETNKVLPYYNIAAISPAGSINSSAKELANWVKVWLNEGQYNNTQILPKAYVEKAINPLMFVGTGIADKAFPDQHLKSYGYAWFVSSYKGHYRLEHGGNIDGFSANVALFPTDKLGIIVLANQDGSALPSLARNIISEELLQLEKTNWIAYYNEKIGEIKAQTKEKEQAEAAGKVPNTVPSHSLAEYTGSYKHLGYGKFRITLKNDSLWAKFPRETAYLKHVHYDIFKPYFIKDGKVDSQSALDVNFNFQTNDLGDIEGVKLKLEPTLAPLDFTRTPETIDISKEILDSYIGSYILSGAELKIYLKDDKLTLFVPNQPEYTLIPIKEREFSIKGLTGFKAGFEEKDGVLNLVLHQPNGTFFAIKK